MTEQPERIEPNRHTARRDRAEVSLTCEVRQGTRPWTQVTLHDISDTGFRIEWRPGFDHHHPLYIRIAGLEALTAHLRWKREDAIGCEFAYPLHPAVHAHLVRQSEQER